MFDFFAGITVYNPFIGPVEIEFENGTKHSTYGNYPTIGMYAGGNVGFYYQTLSNSR
jgi:hypothetical protein